MTDEKSQDLQRLDRLIAAAIALDVPYTLNAEKGGVIHITFPGTDMTMLRVLKEAQMMPDAAYAALEKRVQQEKEAASKKT